MNKSIKFYGILACAFFVMCKPAIAIDMAGLFNFQFKDGQNGATYDATYNHGGSATFAVGQFSLFVDGDITPNSFFAAELQSDLFSANAELQPWQIRTASVTMLQMGNRWKTDLQIGKFNSLMGEFPRRRLPFDNPLFDSPLAYSHLVNLDLDGGFVPGGLGNDVRSISLLGKEMVQTGINATGRLRGTRLEYALALVNNPSSAERDVNVNNNLTPQMRLHWKADNNFNFGVNASQGGYLNSVDKVKNPGTIIYGGFAGGEKSPGNYRQTVVNAYFNYRANRIKAHSEYTASSFEVPNIIQALEANSLYLETKYSFTKDLFCGIRYDTLNFDSRRFSTSNDPLALKKWDYDVTRIEAGIGNFINPSTLAKLSYQTTSYETPTGFVKKDFDLVAGSLSVIF
jgi:hypothetical protein